MTNNKKGGARPPLPIQYFDPNVEYPPNVTSGTMIFDSPATYQQVEVLNSLPCINNQHIGGSYSTIVNPATNRKVSIYSKISRKILRQYLSY